MWSHSHLLNITKEKIIGYCYHSVDDITFGLTQSDHIKQLLLFMG